MDAPSVGRRGRRVGDDGIVVLRALNRELDPHEIRNPGTPATGSP